MSRPPAAAAAGACCANVNYIWFCKWNLIRDDFISPFLLLKARNKRKAICLGNSKSIPLNGPLFCFRIRERSSWFWMGRPSRSWEEPTCLSTCLMASMVFTRPLYNATSSKKHMYTPVNSNLPICPRWCCVVWDVWFWCQMKTAFLCLTHQRLFHLSNSFLNFFLIFLLCGVRSSRESTGASPSRTHVKAGYNPGRGSSSSHWLQMP